MKKMPKLLIGLFMLILAGRSFAAIGYGNNYWAASADIVGMPGSGIVVTDSTYTACQQQFQTAMTNHTAIHGWQFTNIQNCHYIVTGNGPVGQVVGLAPSLELDSTIQDIEHEFHVAKMQKAIKKAIKKFQKKSRVLSRPSRN